MRKHGIRTDLGVQELAVSSIVLVVTGLTVLVLAGRLSVVAGALGIVLFAINLGLTSRRRRPLGDQATVLRRLKSWWQRPWRSEERTEAPDADREPDATSDHVVVGEAVGFDGQPLPKSKNLYGRGTGM